VISCACDEEVGKYLLVSESEERSSDLELDSDNELDDCALLDVVVNNDSNEDDIIVQDFIWEDMENHKGQREDFMAIVGPQTVAKHGKRNCCLLVSMGIIQEPTLMSYFNTKRVMSIRGFGYITRDRLELIFTCLHCANCETISNFQGLEKLQNFPYNFTFE
jgi:hypothetical protein